MSWPCRKKNIIFYIFPGLTATIWKLHAQGKKLRVKSKAVVVGKDQKLCFFQQLSKTTNVRKRPALRSDAIFPSYPLTTINTSWASFSAIMEKNSFFTSPLHTPCLFIFVCWSGFSFSRSTFSQYLLWCRCPWSLATNTMRKWEAVLPCPRASECPEAHEAPGGIRAARTDTRCSLVLVHRMGNPCSSGILGAGESCSCSRSDGTFYFWIFAVREGWRQLWKLFLLTADNSGSRSLFREADIFVRHLQV